MSKQTILPRKNPTWVPAVTRWRNSESEWVGESMSVDGGFLVTLRAVRSLTRPEGTEVSGLWHGDWLAVRLALTVELQLIESGYYERLAKLE